MIKSMDNIETKKNPKREYHLISSASMMFVVLTSISLVLPQSYAEDYKVKIIIKNEDEVNKNATVFIKNLEDKTKETIKVKIDENPEKITEKLSAERGEKIKTCIEKTTDNPKDCDVVQLSKNTENPVKFKLEYKQK